MICLNQHRRAAVEIGNLRIRCLFWKAEVDRLVASRIVYIIVDNAMRFFIEAGCESTRPADDIGRDVICSTTI